MSNRTFAFGLLALALLIAAAPAAASVVGPSLINRPSVDGAANYMFLYEDGNPPAFTTPGLVTSWSFYNDNGTASGNRTLEPIILRKHGGGWEVTGVGATVTTPASMSGVQTFSFDPVDGSAFVGPGYTFAHHDLGNPGSIEYSGVAAGTGTHRYKSFGSSKATAGGAPLTGFSGLDRVYSVQFHAAPAGEAVGNLLIDRPNNDGANGGIFLHNDAFDSTGVLAEWAIFDNDNNTPNRQVTPLLLRQSGSNFFIHGIGQTVTTDESGEQHFAFDLVEGSRLVDAAGSYFFAWKDGSLVADNQGVIDWGDGAVGGLRYFGAGHAGNVYVGRNLGAGNLYDRDYSVVAMLVAPEPAGLALLMLGGFALFPLLRRRR